MALEIRGAREHNLKNIELDIPSGMTVITGISGSGKTSLVFDTIDHEAHRRFLEVYSLTSAARLPPADVDHINGLGPAIAVGQDLLNRNPNATPATAAGLHPFLRLLFSRYGSRFCPACGAATSCASDDEILERIRTMTDGTRSLPDGRSTCCWAGKQENGRPWGMTWPDASDGNSRGGS
ncbi:hypothetical protein JW905_11320 [bacterium]|nr:hypothetical protein [candidate division CSSED10-310 bacterium]